ncbi:5-oxoprolinase subunit PxpB [Limnochorda pilosa]|uniref:Urea amidolyase n=1 Tax=Limnochorda pilosa TaxID=1555112 RepID=A0A0K2SMW1_LIMPI|nr:5-oxoprolinase subunit PxpB [Limnochorda pilosa]BAS28455.1 hypothetical protein LIP_2625 [Limnochorda pilosa]
MDLRAGPAGAGGLYLAPLEERPPLERAAALRGLAHRVEAACLPGVLEVSFGLASLLVRYDPCLTGYHRLVEQVRGVAARRGALPPGPAERTPRTWEVPVVYGGEAGPDLEAVARETGLTPDQVVARHAGAPYTVLALGFKPGFPYLGPLDPALHVDRLARPRPRVPGGSVAIAGPYTGIYPSEAPGGWRLLGRTDRPLVDLRRDPPVFALSGDRVVFRPVGTPVPEAESAVEGLGYPESADGGTALFRVLDPGLRTTWQDGGRPGWMRYGFAPSGPADVASFLAVQRLAGNPPHRAALEFAGRGPVLEALRGTVVVVAGGAGDTPPAGEVLPGEGGRRVRWLWLRRGQRLALNPGPGAAVGYLAIPGGLAAPRVGGSAATDLSAGVGSAFAPGAPATLARPAPGREERPDEAAALWHACLARRGRRLVATRPPDRRRVLWLRLVPEGLQPVPDELFDVLCRTRFRVSARSDRTGVRLEGGGGGVEASGPLPPGPPRLPSDPVVRGTVQLLPSGLPVVLLADHPATGGYLRLGVVDEADLDRLAQALPGQPVAFHPQGLEEAEALHRRRRGWGA